jgi:hypothetical protein
LNSGSRESLALIRSASHITLLQALKIIRIPTATAIREPLAVFRLLVIVKPPNMGLAPPSLRLEAAGILNIDFDRSFCQALVPVRNVDDPDVREIRNLILVLVLFIEFNTGGVAA